MGVRNGKAAKPAYRRIGTERHALAARLGPEFEIASQVVAQLGVAAVMAAKKPEQQGWSLIPALTERYPDALRAVNYRLFEEDFLALVPEARPGARSGPIT